MEINTQKILQDANRLEGDRAIINWKYDQVAIYSGFVDDWGFVYNASVHELYKQNTYYSQQTVQVYSSKPKQAFLNLQSIMMNGMISQGDDWFDVGIAPEYSDEALDPLNQRQQYQRQLQGIKEILRGNLYARDTNFNSAMAHVLRECAIFGNGIIKISHKSKKGKFERLRFDPVRFSEFYAEQDLCGEITLAMQKRVVKASQLKYTYPDMETIYDNADGQADIIIYDYVKKNHRYDDSKKLTEKNCPWERVIFVKNNIVVKTGNNAMKQEYVKDNNRNSDIYVIETECLSYNPFVLFRYNKNPSFVYGHGIGHMLINDLIELNDMYAKYSIATANRVQKPVLVANSLKNIKTGLNIQSGGVTLGGVDSNGRPLILPLDLSDEPSTALEFIAKKEADILNACLNDELQLFRAQGNPPTAYEVQERQLAKEARSSVQFNNVKDSIDDVISTCIEILEFFGKIKPIISDDGRNEKETLKIEYKAPFFNLQKVRTLTGVNQVMTALQPLMQIDPTLAKYIMPAELLNDMFVGAGLSLNGLRNQKEVQAEIDQERQLQQSQIDSQNLAMTAEAKLKNSQADATAQGLGA